MVKEILILDCNPLNSFASTGQVGYFAELAKELT